MKHVLSRRWIFVLLIFITLFVSAACLGSAGSPAGTPAPGGVAVVTGSPVVAQTPGGGPDKVDITFGPGAFNFPDTKAGLADLTSYKATLILSFDGTHAGKAQKWTKTYVELNTAKPAARLVTIEKSGDLPDLTPVFLAEADGAAYQNGTKNSCIASVIDPANSLLGRLEPVGFLNGVIGAEAAGSETVNSVAANHYTFDERAFGQLGLAKSTGAMWVASKTGYIARYVLTTKGDAKYFGEGIEGTLTWDYELTNANQPVAVQLPVDCPAGMVNAPLLADAANTLSMPGLLTFDTATSLADAAAFYQKQIPGLGWKPVDNPTITDNLVLLDYSQGDKTMTIIITTSTGGKKVRIVLGSSQGAVPSS